jgi:tRNA (cmo5U34)-methyltransferase
VNQDELMLMGEFFDYVSKDYDAVHLSHIDRGEEHYQSFSLPVVESLQPVRALDIGCGSGLELEAFFQKVPNAQVDCVDLSAKLMGQLLDKYAGFAITPHLASYLTYPYPRHLYRYIMASSTLHHLIDTEKRRLFSKLREALVPDGCLIVGDYYVSSDDAADRLAQYHQLISTGIDLSDGKYHFDIPTSVEREKELLLEAGFTSVQTIWESSNYAILVANIA